MPWAREEALAPIGGQDSIGHDIGPRTSKPSSSSEESSSRILRGYCGAKGSRAPTHFILSARPLLRRKKGPRTNKGNPDCQDILPRTTLSSADQNHGRGKRHTTRGSPLEHPKGSSKSSGPAIGAWWKSNSRRSCHIRIKYPQLTP